LEFLEIFPEIELVKEKELKEKTENIWQKAMELGGWKQEDLFKIPFTLLIPDTDINIVEHTKAVTDVALMIVDALIVAYDNIEINRDYLIVGGLLHDVGKLLEYEYKDGAFSKSRKGNLLRHPVIGANLATEFGLPPEIIHIIYTHSKEGENYRRSIESIIIHHSDFINFDVLKKLNNA